MERISNYQLYAMIVLFQIGTSIVFGFASDAGRDAWIVVLISATIGAIFNLMCLLTMRMNKGLTLVEAYICQFGKWLGAPIAWSYIIVVIYVTGRTLGDLRFLIPVTILPRTPILLILAIFMLVIAYALFSGLEVIARLTEIFLPFILILFVIEVILIISSDIINFHNLQPILSKGWKPIWKSVFPLGIYIGFGESFIFFMIWPYTKQCNKTIKAALLATITTGFLITTLDILAISVLGEGIFKNSIYPLHMLVKQIDIANFLENLDVIEVLYFLTTSFFKISIYSFAIIKAIQKLTVVKNYRIYILPVLIIVLYLSLTMSTSVISHIESGLQIKPNLLTLVYYYTFPTILFIVTLTRKMRKMKKIKKSN